MQAVFIRSKETPSLGTVCVFRRAKAMKNGFVIEFTLEEQLSREESNRVLSGRILFVDQLPEDIIKKSDVSVNANLHFLWNNLNEREQRVIQADTEFAGSTIASLR
uniref:Acylphosphatase-like domain-containing protein n=1 Tax=Ascaris lumbricoides TaxID=6252 RepID=A0A0M3IN72_ASCLU